MRLYRHTVSPFHCLFFFRSLIPALQDRVVYFLESLPSSLRDWDGMPLLLLLLLLLCCENS